LVFITFFFLTFCFNLRGISVGAFGIFGVENSKTRGSRPGMPKTGSPLAKGELIIELHLYV
jgi:hypothetical protein